MTLRDRWARSRQSWYAGGRAGPVARRWARLYGDVFAWGLLPRTWVAFEVAGRRTGKIIRIPLGLVTLDDNWYLVSMLGECNWTKNLRAAGGRAAIVRRGWHPITTTPVRVELRPPIIKRYLETVPGARPHIRLDPAAPVEAFTQVAERIPVFLIDGYP